MLTRAMEKLAVILPSTLKDHRLFSYAPITSLIIYTYYNQINFPDIFPQPTSYLKKL